MDQDGSRGRRNEGPEMTQFRHILAVTARGAPSWSSEGQIVPPPPPLAKTRRVNRQETSRQKGPQNNQSKGQADQLGIACSPEGGDF